MTCSASNATKAHSDNFKVVLAHVLLSMLRDSVRRQQVLPAGRGDSDNFNVLRFICKKPACDDVLSAFNPIKVVFKTGS